jgi:6-phosphogluconolactonase
MTAINAAREVWVVAAGEEKATAARLALSGAGPTAVPAAGVHGRARTLWLLDRAAASRLPASLPRLASP